MDALPTIDLEPAQILAAFDQALADPDVTVSRLRCLGRILSGQPPVEDFIDEETLSWVSQFVPSPTMYVCNSTLKEEVLKHNIHGDPATALATQQLQAIDFGMLNGQQVKDLERSDTRGIESPGRSST